jgi:hypothetical protein
VNADTEPTHLDSTYFEIQQFYAEHMQLLDSGDAAGWAATFTEDGIFDPPPPRPPVRGRKNLADGAARAAAERAEKREVHRHWHGMVAVQPIDADSVRVTCYALIVVTPAGGEPRLQGACICTDQLVRDENGWSVRHRRVTNDRDGAHLIR